MHHRLRAEQKRHRHVERKSEACKGGEKVQKGQDLLEGGIAEASARQSSAYGLSEWNGVSRALGRDQLVLNDDRTADVCGSGSFQLLNGLRQKVDCCLFPGE